MPYVYGSQVDYQKIPVKNIVVESAASAPASPVNGQLWYDTSVNRFKVYENGTWILASLSGVEFTANKGTASGYASLDGSTKVPIAQIPTGSTGSTVPFGNDARFTDQRVPTDGSVTGGPAGSGVKIAASTITHDNVATANKDGAAATPSLRTLGTGAAQALAGNTRLDQVAAPTSAVSMNGQRLTNGAASAASTDYVIKSELDAARQGIAGVKDPVRVAAQANVTLSSPGATIDGVSLSANDRFLAPAQTTTTEKGIYVWNGAAVAATRAADADATGEILDGTLVAVSEGTDAGKQYIQTATPSGAPGAWSQVWTIYNTGGTTYTAGNGLQLSANQFSAKKDTADANNYITIGAGGIGVGTTPIALGGTGATTAVQARTNLGALGKYAANMGALTAGVETTFTHGLNSTDVIASFKTVADNTVVFLSWRTIDATSIGVTADIAYAASAVRAVVVG